MDSDKGQIRFGKPDFWPNIASKHAQFFEKAPKLEQAIASIVDPARSIDNNQHVILMLLQLVAIGVMEAVTLVGNGMAHGAMKIVRGIVENSVNAEYIRQFPDQGEKYREWYWMERYKLLKVVRERSPELLADIKPEQLAQIEAEYQRVKPLFIYQTQRPNGTQRTVMQKTWCRENLLERAEKIGAAVVYETVMPRSNPILHGSMTGWISEYDEVNVRIDYPPTDRWSTEALIASHAALLQAIETATKALDATPEPSIAELEEDFNAIWHTSPDPGTAATPE